MIHDNMNQDKIGQNGIRHHKKIRPDRMIRDETRRDGMQHGSRRILLTSFTWITCRWMKSVGVWAIITLAGRNKLNPSPRSVRLVLWYCVGYFEFCSPPHLNETVLLTILFKKKIFLLKGFIWKEILGILLLYKFNFVLKSK